MALAEDIYAKLSTDTGILTACGLASPSTAPVYPVKAPPGSLVFPFVVWLVVSSIPDVSHTGAAGIDATLLQFSCFGSTYTQANALRKAVRNALDGQSLQNGQAVSIEAERDLYDPQTDAFHCELDAHLMRNALA